MTLIDSGTAIGIVTLRVADMERVAAFYQNVMGLILRERVDSVLDLGTPNRTLVRLHHTPTGRSVAHSTGLYHLALRVPSRFALADWFLAYAQAEFPGWQGASDHGVSEALYLQDPEGNGIEVYWDRPQSGWRVAEDGTIDIYTRYLDLQALLEEGKERTPHAIAPETDLGHIHLKVADLTATRHFYVDALGFGLKMELPHSALFVAAGAYHHHLGLNIWHSHQAPALSTDALGLAQFELLFAHESARQAAVERLRQAGYAVEDGSGGTTVLDPAGIEMALISLK